MADKTRTFTFKTDEDLANELEVRRNERGQSLSDYVREVIEADLYTPEGHDNQAEALESKARHHRALASRKREHEEKLRQHEEEVQRMKQQQQIEDAKARKFADEKKRIKAFSRQVWRGEVRLESLDPDMIPQVQEQIQNWESKGLMRPSNTE